MRYQVLKQYIAIQENDPIDFQRGIWVEVLPEKGDRIDIFQNRERAEESIEHKIELQNEKDELGNDQIDKFGLKIKDRIYKIIEIE